MKNNLLIIVDVQNDFVTGTLGTKEAQETVPKIRAYLEKFQGDRIFTMDTHQKDYMSTNEGRHLPVAHTVEHTRGWMIAPEINAIRKDTDVTLKKPTFGSADLLRILQNHHYNNIYLCGFCTGICVISNAVIAKTADPEANIHILSDLCACVTPESHTRALQAMELLQMEIIK